MRDCRVNHLQVRATDAAAARRGARLVEDALRTASLPGESSRLVVVRRLALGVLSAGASPGQAARQVEAALRAAPVQAVHATDPRAAHAAAVYFEDEMEPLVLLAVQGAAGRAPVAWFWRRAVPALPVHAGAGTAVRCALLSAAQAQPGPATVARVVAALHAEGLLDAALHAVAPEDGPLLCRLCGWESPGPPHITDAAGAMPPWTLPQASAALLSAWATRWGRADARTWWLAVALLTAEQPSLTAGPQLVRRANAWMETSLEGTQPSTPGGRSTGEMTTGDPAAHAAGDPLLVSTPPALRHTAPASAPGRTTHTPVPAAAVPAEPGPAVEAVIVPHLSQAPAPVAENQAGKQVATAPPAVTPWHSLPLRFSAAAGVWLLVRLLAYLRLPAWLRDHPAAPPDLGAHILADVCRSLDVPEGDAIWLELPSGAPPAETAGLVRSWRSALDDWFTGQPNLVLASLVRSPGWFYTTRTHLDVFYDLEGANPMVRRLGLDLDPGWVPWLGRVITLHYETDLPAAPQA